MKETDTTTNGMTASVPGPLVLALLTCLAMGALGLRVGLAQGPEYGATKTILGPDHVSPGHSLTYRLYITRTEQGRSTIAVSDTLPAHTTFVTMTVNALLTMDSGYDEASRTVYFWGDVWAGTSSAPVTIVYTVTVEGSVLQGNLAATAPITNLAQVYSDTIPVAQTNVVTAWVEPAHIYLPLILRSHPPVWKQGAGTDNTQFRAPSGCGSTIWYAGTWDQGVWKSTDTAANWTQIAALAPNPYPVVANPNDCNQAFVSVWGLGIYRITGGSSSPVNNGLGELNVYGLAITSTKLYAGTSSQGVYKTDINTIAWQAVNSGINERRIRSLATIGNGVYAGARACKLYESTNGGASWSEQTVLTGGAGGSCGDAQVWSVAKVKTVLYAGLAGKGLYRNGAGWQRVTDVPELTVYGLAYDGTNDYLYVSTYGSGIYRCDVDGTGLVQECQQHNPGLTTLNMREVAIHNELLVAGSDDGVWYMPVFR